MRAGAVWAFAAEEIDRRIAEGESVRDDGFFDIDETGQRPAAEEVLEAVTIAATASHEERKVRYMGRLYAAIAFTPGISRAAANFLIAVASRLTYRQLRLVAIVGTTDALPPVQSWSPPRSHEIVAELDELGNSGVIGVKQSDGSVAHIAAVLGGGTFGAFGFEIVGLTETGQRLFDCMGLSVLPAPELEELRHELEIPRVIAPDAPVV